MSNLKFWLVILFMVIFCNISEASVTEKDFLKTKLFVRDFLYQNEFLEIEKDTLIKKLELNNYKDISKQIPLTREINGIIYGIFSYIPRIHVEKVADDNSYKEMISISYDHEKKEVINNYKRKTVYLTKKVDKPSTDIINCYNELFGKPEFIKKIGVRSFYYWETHHKNRKIFVTIFLQEQTEKTVLIEEIIYTHY